VTLHYGWYTLTFAQNLSPYFHNTPKNEAFYSQTRTDCSRKLKHS